MRTKDYITATTELLREGKEAGTLLDSLKQHLASRGRMKLYPSILRGITRTLAQKEKREGVKVVVAREGDAQKYAAEITEQLTKIGATAHTLEVDDTLIGGFVIKTKDTQIDKSHKHTLLHAYRALIG